MSPLPGRSFKALHASSLLIDVIRRQISFVPEIGSLASQGHHAVFDVNGGVPKLTQRLKQEHGVHFSTEQESESVLSNASLISSLLSTLLTPGSPATVSWANVLWEVTETVPVRETT